ncbi:MAG: hypothetical protein M3Y93_14165 [Pseudomonadota bacterium]|nr:hypothetical protein [Pseudomonadota bacterium]
MNHETDDIPRFDDPAHEREWLAQESAMRRERLHLDPAGDEPRSQRYRLLTRALRTATANALPTDFAQQMNAIVSTPVHRRTPAMALEQVMTSALIGVLLLTAVTVTVLYGASWWPSFEVMVPAAAAARWWLALLGCLGMSWMLGAVLQRFSLPR